MNRIPTALILATAVSGLFAQATNENRAFLRVGPLISDGELRDYMGGRVLGQSYELGYDFGSEDKPIGLDVFINYLVARGKQMPQYKGLQQTLYGWRLGVDSRFRTPLKGFTPYIGANLSFWDGRRVTGGVIPNLDNPAAPFKVNSGPYPEGKAKFGARVGFEYKFTPAWGMTVDYNFSEWYWDNSGAAGMTGTRTIKGVNPVRPAWVGLALQYRWSAF